MARKPKPKAKADTTKTFDEFVEEADAVEEDVEDLDPDSLLAAGKARDWRDVERYKELRELRRLVADDLDLDDLDT